MINPLDMRGPQFLGFYLVYGVGVFLLLALLRALWDRWHAAPATRFQPGTYPAESDAYAIALLRGGPPAVARALLARLVAEDLFILKRRALRRPAEPARNRSRLSPLEEEAFRILSSAAGGKQGIEAQAALATLESALEPRLQPLRHELEGAGLVPGRAQTAGYRALGVAALLAVTGFGATKLIVALSRGRTNVLFLLVLLGVSVVAAVALMRVPRLTQAGNRYLSWLTESHHGLRTMLADGRRHSFGELALIAGIVGLEDLSVLSRLQKALTSHPARPRGTSAVAKGSGGVSGYSSCSTYAASSSDIGGHSSGAGYDSGGSYDSGSSCGSGSSGSSGSGCGGGGGCGGGCGGCGGG